MGTTRIRWLRLLLGTALAGLALGVVGLVIIFQPREPRLSALGEEVDAGGFDSHLHFAVEEVQFLTEWGAPTSLEPDDPADPPARSGLFCLVTVRARNSAAGDLTVDPRRYRVFVRAEDRQTLLPANLGPGPNDERPVTRFTRELSPEAEDRATFLFEIPPDATGLFLWISETNWIADRYPWLEYTILHPKLVLPLQR